MGLEIEHKYLVVDDSFLSMQSAEFKIRQGYLSRDPLRTVRIRIFGDKGFITIKGETKGSVRSEFEYEIPTADAAELLKLCEGPILEKTRHIVFFDDNRWEVDVFEGRLSGLRIAEIEIPSPDFSYSLPPFVGENVTGSPEYYNSNL